MGPHRPNVAPVRAVVAALTAVVLLVLAGCGGSSISPKKAAEAQNALLGNQGAAGNGSGLVPSDGQSGSVDNPVPGADPTAPSGSGNPTAPTSNGGGGGGGGGNSNGGGGGGGSVAPPKGVSGASCNGFANGTGITNDTIRIGNSSDISGPVPGLFTQAQQATKAFVAYFNNSGAKICGRKLVLDNYDSHTDAGGDQAGYTKGCASDFAMVGSMSSFDSGGAKTAQDCGLPDVRAIATTVDRGNCTTCFGAQPAGPYAFQNAVPDFIIRKTGGKKAAMLYINIGASAANGISQQKHETERGMKFVYTSPIDVADFNYGPYVQAMKSKGVTSVQFIASDAQFARLVQAFKANNFSPKLFLIDPTGYDANYPSLAGADAKGTTVFLNFVPFEESSTSPEERLYMQYLQQVSPGAKPGFFGVFAWSAARLFVEQATKLGGKLNRKTLIAAVKKVDNWTANGMHAPQHVGSKKIGDCWRFIQWSGSAWVPTDGTKYQCRGLSGTNP
ncbi:MAG: ABC transporter substrate-binding protein [Marmoricola sp.]